MIYQGTYLKVIDNSGARFALCIKVFKQKAKRATVGNKILVSVKKINPRRKIVKGSMYPALVVRDKRQTRRGYSQSYFKFASSACVLLKKDGLPLGKQIKGPVPKELRYLGHIRLVSLATVAI